MKVFAAEQKRMDAYIEKRLDSMMTSGNNSFRFASGQVVPSQTAFQRHVCSLIPPANYGHTPEMPRPLPSKKEH